MLHSVRNDKCSTRHDIIWSADGLTIIGITDTGRGTCNRLDLNDEYHNEGSIIKARRLWVKGGWHPPEDDPRLESEL